CAIDPEGRMSICVLSHRDTFDLRRGTLREGWDQFLARVRDKRITRVTKCTSCQLKSVCGMCPANAELEAGDPEKPVDFLCHVGHLRALPFGGPTPGRGGCEFCRDGARGAEVAAQAARLRQGTSPRTARRAIALPLAAGASPASGCASGCGSCGTC